MDRPVRFPIRLKIMISLLFGITVVVSVITFTMAHFFHEDKRSYLGDWVSIATRSTAAECRSLLERYEEQLEFAGSILIDEEIRDSARARLVQGVFDSLPELVGISVYWDGQQVEVAADASDLERAGLAERGLAAFHEGRPLPFEELAGGATYLRNSTITKDMPTITMAFRLQGAGDAPVTAAGVLRVDELWTLGAKFKVFEVVLADADGALLAHPDLRRVAARYPAALRPEARSADAERQAGMAFEFDDQGTPMIGAFAAVGKGGVTAAAQIPKSAANLASRALIGRLLLVALGLLLLMAVVGRFWARRIVRPVERLSEASRAIGQGRFDIEVDVESHDEIGALAGSFNQMAHELKTRDEALAAAQAQLIQSEKLAAFGQLGAGIAHEVKNPLAGILGCAQLSLMEVGGETPLRKNLEIIEKETRRCRSIIDNLLKFARQEKALFEPTEVNRVIADTCAIIQHQLELQRVKIITELAETLPPIQGNANQLQQVLMNLMINAQQALDGRPGTVRVATRRAGQGPIEIEVRDDGPGIPEEIRHRLFEPFFTTKPRGKGTGLGLSVSFGIIKDHHGEISVESEVGRGTAFLIRLPAARPPERAGVSA